MPINLPPALASGESLVNPFALGASAPRNFSSSLTSASNSALRFEDGPSPIPSVAPYFPSSAIGELRTIPAGSGLSAPAGPSQAVARSAPLRLECHFSDWGSEPCALKASLKKAHPEMDGNEKFTGLVSNYSQALSSSKIAIDAAYFASHDALQAAMGLGTLENSARAAARTIAATQDSSGAIGPRVYEVIDSLQHQIAVQRQVIEGLETDLARSRSAIFETPRPSKISSFFMRNLSVDQEKFLKWEGKEHARKLSLKDAQHANNALMLNLNGAQKALENSRQFLHRTLATHFPLYTMLERAHAACEQGDLSAYAALMSAGESAYPVYFREAIAPHFKRRSGGLITEYSRSNCATALKEINTLLKKTWESASNSYAMAVTAAHLAEGVEFSQWNKAQSQWEDEKRDYNYQMGLYDKAVSNERMGELVATCLSLINFAAAVYEIHRYQGHYVAHFAYTLKKDVTVTTHSDQLGIAGKNQKDVKANADEYLVNNSKQTEEKFWVTSPLFDTVTEAQTWLENTSITPGDSLILNRSFGDTIIKVEQTAHADTARIDCIAKGKMPPGGISREALRELGPQPGGLEARYSEMIKVRGEARRAQQRPLVEPFSIMPAGVDTPSGVSSAPSLDPRSLPTALAGAQRVPSVPFVGPHNPAAISISARSVTAQATGLRMSPAPSAAHQSISFPETPRVQIDSVLPQISDVGRLQPSSALFPAINSHVEKLPPVATMGIDHQRRHKLADAKSKFFEDVGKGVASSPESPMIHNHQALPLPVQAPAISSAGLKAALELVDHDGSGEALSLSGLIASLPAPRDDVLGGRRQTMIVQLSNSSPNAPQENTQAIAPTSLSEAAVAEAIFQAAYPGTHNMIETLRGSTGLISADTHHIRALISRLPQFLGNGILIFLRSDNSVFEMYTEKGEIPVGGVPTGVPHFVIRQNMTNGHYSVIVGSNREMARTEHGYFISGGTVRDIPPSAHSLMQAANLARTGKMLSIDQAIACNGGLIAYAINNARAIEDIIAENTVIAGAREQARANALAAYRAEVYQARPEQVNMMRTTVGATQLSDAGSRPLATDTRVTSSAPSADNFVLSLLSSAERKRKSAASQKVPAGKRALKEIPAEFQEWFDKQIPRDLTGDEINWGPYIVRLRASLSYPKGLNRSMLARILKTDKSNVYRHFAEFDVTLSEQVWFDDQDPQRQAESQPDFVLRLWLDSPISMSQAKLAFLAKVSPSLVSLVVNKSKGDYNVWLQRNLRGALEDVDDAEIQRLWFLWSRPWYMRPSELAELLHRPVGDIYFAMGYVTAKQKAWYAAQTRIDQADVKWLWKHRPMDDKNFKYTTLAGLMRRPPESIKTALRATKYTPEIVDLSSSSSSFSSSEGPLVSGPAMAISATIAQPYTLFENAQPLAPSAPPQAMVNPATRRMIETLLNPTGWASAEAAYVPRLISQLPDFLGDGVLIMIMNDNRVIEAIGAAGGLNLEQVPDHVPHYVIRQNAEQNHYSVILDHNNTLARTDDGYFVTGGTAHVISDLGYCLPHAALSATLNRVATSDELDHFRARLANFAEQNAENLEPLVDDVTRNYIIADAIATREAMEEQAKALAAYETQAHPEMADQPNRNRLAVGRPTSSGVSHLASTRATATSLVAGEQQSGDTLVIPNRRGRYLPSTQDALGKLVRKGVPEPVMTWFNKEDKRDMSGADKLLGRYIRRLRLSPHYLAATTPYLLARLIGTETHVICTALLYFDVLPSQHSWFARQDVRKPEETLPQYIRQLWTNRPVGDVCFTEATVAGLLGIPTLQVVNALTLPDRPLYLEQWYSMQLGMSENSERAFILRSWRDRPENFAQWHLNRKNSSANYSDMSIRSPVRSVPGLLDLDGLEPEYLDVEGLDLDGLEPEYLDVEGLDLNGLEPEYFDVESFAPDDNELNEIAMNYLALNELAPEYLDLEDLNLENFDLENVALSDLVAAPLALDHIDLNELDLELEPGALDDLHLARDPEEIALDQIALTYHALKDLNANALALERSDPNNLDVDFDLDPGAPDELSLNRDADEIALNDLACDLDDFADLIGVTRTAVRKALGLDLVTPMQWAWFKDQDPLDLSKESLLEYIQRLSASNPPNMLRMELASMIGVARGVVARALNKPSGDIATWLAENRNPALPPGDPAEILRLSKLPSYPKSLLPSGFARLLGVPVREVCDAIADLTPEQRAWYDAQLPEHKNDVMALWNRRPKDQPYFSRFSLAGLMGRPPESIRSVLKARKIADSYIQPKHKKWFEEQINWDPSKELRAIYLHRMWNMRDVTDKTFSKSVLARLTGIKYQAVIDDLRKPPPSVAQQQRRSLYPSVIARNRAQPPCSDPGNSD
ncbi:hypothetical protein [Glaciimonas immobilis]|uniref:Uncharacterized protein n=1 Tax=Glaciimonas immobilis TaxID=728004 RepID=A0A840RU58_9BURK|nr:hypothetical protein [Glaciimonas immobilis]KAF3997142.1 hypothetical protein HAV38_15895 [Glaciimonas immobilis]MBB5200009.1 hypothetical protein [Glaciimonas immobilis]